MIRRLFFSISLSAIAVLNGCGGWILGEVLSPPSLSITTAERAIEQTPTPQNEWPIARPVAIRVYPTGEVIVDVLVMIRGVQPRWESKPGEPVSPSEAISMACFFTNNIGVPAKLNSTRRDGPSIVIRNDKGTVIPGARAILGVLPFESNRERLQARGNANHGVRLVSVTRGDKPFNACFVPVLLATQEPVSVGEWVDVRIRPPSADGEYYIDDRWYRVRVEAFEPPGDQAKLADDAP